MAKKPREKLSSRLGFILVAAGCAIGLGNVYRFPITTSAYGGAIFVLVYLIFLLLVGVPVMTCELAVGRLSQRSIATSFDVLEKPKQKWHLAKFIGVGANYLLVMFYTTISSWFVIYFFNYVNGSILQWKTPLELDKFFMQKSGDPLLSVLVTFGVIAICFLVCSFGLQNGVEKVSKVLMIVLFAIIIGLVVYSLTLNNALEAIKFYFVPDFDSVKKVGLWPIITSALGQAFFTLSIGCGAVAIFGSYINKERKLFSETLTIVSLDTFVALMSGLIIFPACFTYGNGTEGIDAETISPAFLFTNLSAVFNHMPGGRIVGSAFFLFLIFAAVSTIIAVFENITSFWLETTNLSRIKIAVINITLIAILSIPAMLSSNLLSNVHILGFSVLNFEDFLMSNIFLPLGGLIYVVFCTWRYGIGFDAFRKEVNTGSKGLGIPKWIKGYMKFILPLVIIFILIFSVVQALG